MRKLFVILLLFLCVSTAYTQSTQTKTSTASRIRRSAAAPVTCSSAYEGMVYQNTTSHKAYFCNGTTWTEVGGGGVGTASTTEVLYSNAGAIDGVSGATSDGTNMTFSLGALRATSPFILTGIVDTNNKQVLGLTATGSAVNNFSMTNAATGAGPTLSAVGTDTNIDININPKGSSGAVYFDSQRIYMVGGSLGIRNNTASTYASFGTSGNSFVAITNALPRIQSLYQSGIGFAPDSSGVMHVGLNTDTSGQLLLNDGSSTVTNYRDIRLRGVQYSTGSKPTCNSTNRGYTWYVAGGAGVADTFEVCRKDAADAYAWVTLF